MSITGGALGGIGSRLIRSLVPGDIGEVVARPGLVRPVLIVTVFAVASQAVGLATQVVIAGAFGARADMDAFLAANTLPQYAIAAFLSVIGFVLIPLFVEYTAVRGEAEAWQVASGVINICLLALGGLAVTGVFWAEPLLRLTTPGLKPESLHLASRVAVITWPTILATAVFTILTSIYQARERFGWPAAVPVIGSLTNLGLVLVLARWLGVIGLAIAAATSVVLQAALVLRIGLGTGRYRPVLNWRHPGVQQAIGLLTPLVLSGLLVRWTPLVERYVASTLPTGSISHLSYSLKFPSLLTLLLSTGLATVVFPRMAVNTTAGDILALKQTVSLGLRLMWVAVAPTIVLGGVLALPVVTVLLRRGEFSAADAAAVAALLQIYLLAVVGTCLGNVTGRTFYAMKDTRTVAGVGVLEALAYAVYTALLAGRFGVLGVAWGYVLYFDLSLLWQVFVIRYKTGNTGGRTVLASFARTALAAVLGGAATWAVTVTTSSQWMQIFLGGVLGLTVYAVALLALGSGEGWALWTIVRARIRLGAHRGFQPSHTR